MVLAVVALMGTAVGAQERERLISEAQGLVPGVLSDVQLDSLDRGWLVAKELLVAKIGSGSWEPCEEEIDARRERVTRGPRTGRLTGSWELGWDDGTPAYSLWDETWAGIDWGSKLDLDLRQYEGRDTPDVETGAGGRRARGLARGVLR